MVDKKVCKRRKAESISPLLNIIKKIGNHSGGFRGLIAYIVRKKAFHKTQTNFLIRNIKRIKVQNLIIIL